LDRREQLGLAAVLLRADADQLPPQAIEFVGLRRQLQRVGLVGYAKDRHLHVAQPPGHLFVHRRQAFPGVDHEQDHVGRIDRDLDLLLDVLAEVVGIVHAHSAGIDQFHEATAHVCQMRDAIPGDARRGIDNRDSPTGKPVENTRLADVRPTDNDNLRHSHTYHI